MSDRTQIRLRIDNTDFARVKVISSEKGITPENYIETAIHKSLSDSNVLTELEQTAYKLKLLYGRTTTYKNAMQEQVKSDLLVQLIEILALNRLYKLQNKNHSRNAIHERELFNILNDLEKVDKNLFDQAVTLLADFGRLKNRYFYSQKKLCDSVTGEAKL